MPCKSYGSENLHKGEIAIHFPGSKKIDKPIGWVFAENVVCLNSGLGESAVPQAELRLLQKGNAAQRRMTSDSAGVSRGGALY